MIRKRIYESDSLAVQGKLETSPIPGLVSRIARQQEIVRERTLSYERQRDIERVEIQRRVVKAKPLLTNQPKINVAVLSSEILTQEQKACRKITTALYQLQRKFFARFGLPYGLAKKGDSPRKIIGGDIRMTPLLEPLGKIAKHQKSFGVAVKAKAEITPKVDPSRVIANPVDRFFNWINSLFERKSVEV